MTLNISFANRLCALWFVLGLIWRSPTGAAGEDLYVSASSGSDSSSCNESFPCLSLGYALAQASPSSSIFVLPGIYSGNENSNLCEDGTCAYDIKIEGLGLPEEIVLQNTLLGASSRAFYINNNDITSINNITITGFVYTNILEGNVGGGGAIYISNTDISLSNLILANNSAQSGGALSVYLSNTTIDGCQFLANFAIDHGGAFSSYSSAIVVSNSLFADNNATSQTFTGIGGAIYYLEPRGKRTMTIFNSAFVRNFATRAGGAVYVESVANTAEAFSAFYTKFDGNSVLGTETCNSASACSSRGGALYLLAVGAIIVDCVFDHNTALVRTETDSAGGGAIYSVNINGGQLQPFTTAISNCSFTNNLATGDGGAISLVNQLLVLDSSIFTNNAIQPSRLYFTDTAALGGALSFTGASSVATTIKNCTFADNIAQCGWGGALYLSGSTTIYVEQSNFIGNVVLSSYTTSARGGAIMVANGLKVVVNDSSFRSNYAKPYLNRKPLTFSGTGGAIFMQSSTGNFSKSFFQSNYAFTGQFDDGSSGGAVTAEDSVTTFSECLFSTNAAIGYFGYSAFASSGAGGALLFKFSSAFVHESVFEGNWVSVGGATPSLGGAVAVYFTISSVEESTIGPIEFSSCVFRNNTAFAQLCVNSGLKEGQGGAISIVGVSFPALVLRNCNFTYNVAMTYVGSSLPSIGGAMAITQSSNLTMEDGYLGYNLAMYGIGNDLASVTSDLEDQNYVNIRNITFAALPDTGATTKLISATQSSFRQYCSVVSDIVSDSQSENALSGKFYTLSEECTKLVETHGREIALTKNCRQRKQASTHILSKRELKQANDMNGFDFVAEKELGHTISGLQLLSLSETELLYHHIQSMQFETGRFSEFTTIFEGKRSEQYQEDSRHISIGAWVKDALISRYNEFSLKEVYHSQKRLHAAKRKAKNDSYSSHSNFLTEVFTGQSSSFLFSNFTDALQNFLAYRISVVATSGQTFISNPTFIGKTHLYFGDYLKINADPSSSSNSLSIHPSVSLIEGTLIQEDLTISIVSAVLTLSNPQKRFVLGQLNVFNSTLYIIDNITVSGTSFAANSKIMGIRKVVGEESFTGVDSSFGKSVDNPSITFMQNFITGYSIQSLQNIRDHRKIDLIGINNNETVMSNMELNSVSLIVENGLLLATSFSRSTFSLDKLINFSLLNRAVINIISGASLNIVANTLIKAESSTSPALKNSGQINLLGDSNSVLSLLGISSNRVSPPSTADLGSLTSILDVDGTFQQLSSGSVNIKLNSTGQSIPVLNLISNQSLSGALNLNFDKVTNPDVELYDTDNPSKWSLVSFQVLKESVGETSPLIINAPEGLEFSMKLNSSVNTKRFLDHNVSFTLSVVIENIGCAYVNTYYSGVSLNDPSGYNCYVCLQNSSCNLCSDGYCEVEGMCANDAVSFSSNCCGSNCNSPYGKCVASDDYKSFSCKCESALFTGSDCKELQTYIIILIVIGGSLLLMLLFAIFSYKRSQKQKTMVLEELRDGLLRNTMGANNEYIQYMQQALILNDVFVKFEEIKLESKIGEGSFGVVHKATFRGAQVAVKMMRSLFIELTEKDIDEFRKEAYMMSRLRHPNIVLVMGISLVNQEPVQIPPSRFKQLSDDDSTCPKSVDRSGKTTPPKTVCIITEYLEQGSLADILYGPSRLPSNIWTYELVLTCAVQAARGMLYLHSHQPPICHRDLKSSNLVVDDHWVVKVTDFGMSRIIPEKVQDMDKQAHYESDGFNSDDNGRSTIGRNTQFILSGGRPTTISPEMTSNMGTTAWCAPEVLTSSSRTYYSVKVDVYSFGVVLWELWERKRPFEEYSSRFDIMDAVKSGQRPIISESCPAAYRSLIQRCWYQDPARRPMFKYIVRYLNDELSRIRRLNPRQKSQSLVLTSMELGRLASTYDPSEDDPSLVERASAFFRRSFATAVESNQSNDFDSRTVNNPLKDTEITIPKCRQLCASDSFNIETETFSTNYNNIDNGKPLVDKPDGNASRISPPELKDQYLPPTELQPNRAKLIAASDRSLSHLASSPSDINECLSPLYGGTETNNNIDKFSESTRLSDLGFSKPPPAFKSAKKGGQWRDRYVLKASGWSSTEPDTGLPPSLTLQQKQGGNKDQQK